MDAHGGFFGVVATDGIPVAWRMGQKVSFRKDFRREAGSWVALFLGKGEMLGKEGALKP
jgi:hypothetical protein